MAWFLPKEGLRLPKVCLGTLDRPSQFSHAYRETGQIFEIIGFHQTQVQSGVKIWFATQSEDFLGTPRRRRVFSATGLCATMTPFVRQYYSGVQMAPTRPPGTSRSPQHHQCASRCGRYNPQAFGGSCSPPHLMPSDHKHLRWTWQKRAAR